MLAYGTVLPSLVKFEGRASDASVFKRLWESKGMEALLYKMSKDQPERKWFVDPIAFWMRKSDDHSRYSAIHDCMWDYQLKLQRTSV